MKSKRLKREPYQYSVLILGPRQHNYTVSDYKGLDTPQIRTYNDSFIHQNFISPNIMPTEREISISRWRRDGYGHDSYGSSGYGSHSYCPEGIPVETALFAITGAAALAFGILFMAITKITMMGRRRRRELSNLLDSPVLYSDILSDLLWEGTYYL